MTLSSLSSHVRQQRTGVRWMCPQPHGFCDPPEKRPSALLRVPQVLVPHAAAAGIPGGPATRARMHGASDTLSMRSRHGIRTRPVAIETSGESERMKPYAPTGPAGTLITGTATTTSGTASGTSYRTRMDMTVMIITTSSSKTDRPKT